MNKSFLKNMKLFKLVEYNHSYRKIINLVKNLGDKSVTPELIIEILGDNSTSKNIIRDISVALNSEHYSLWCLIYYGVSSFSIEKLKDTFDDLNILALRVHDLYLLGLHELTINKIKQLINDLNLNDLQNLENEILNIIEERQPIINRNLKAWVFSRHLNVDSKMFDSLIDSMIIRNLISNNITGYKIKNKNLLKYLANSNEIMNKIVLNRCNGKTLEQCGKELGLTKERIRQKISKQIESLPIFENENEYYEIRRTYSFSQNELNILNFDIILWNYIGIKYNNINPTKNSIDYLKDNRLLNKKIGKLILKENKLIVIDNEIIEDSFINVFVRYVHDNNLKTINLKDVTYYFNNFLQEHEIDNKEYFIDDNSIDILCRKIETSGKFLNVGSKRFIFFERCELALDFIELMRQYLKDFQGYGSVLLFFEQNKMICNQNQINDEKELFVIMKTLFSDEFKESIEFIRNPTIAQKGINRETYIENLLLDLQLPCRVEEYLDYIKSVTGLRQVSVFSNFSNVINRHKNTKGLLSLESEYTKEDEQRFVALLNNRECIGTNFFKFQIEKEFLNKSKTFLNSNTIRKFGYCKTNTSIYKNYFQSRLEAVQNMLEKEKIILSGEDIRKFTNLEFLISKQFDILKECLIIKIGNNKYLNIVARKEQEIIKELKRDLLNLLEDNEIYVLDEFVEEYIFQELLNKGKDYNNILFSFDTKEILKFIFSTTEGFNFLKQQETFLFSKGRVSYETIINQIMHDNGTLTKIELAEIIFEKYGINKNFSSTELSNMGYYCPQTSEKVYLNRDYYEYEMEAYLNGNS